MNTREKKTEAILQPFKMGQSEAGNPQSAIRNPQSKGFTLIELIIVLTIISILLSIAIPTYQAVILRAKESVLQTNLHTMRRKIEEFAADNGRYPPSLQDMVERKYLKEIPLDPITNARDTWQEVPDDSSGSSSDSQPGIKDVKSGAEGESPGTGKSYSDF